MSEEIKNEESQNNTELKNEKKAKANFCCFKNLFSMQMLSIFFCACAIVFGLFFQFLPIVATKTATINAAAAFMFLGYLCASSAVVVETINLSKAKSFNFSFKYILIIIAFLVVIF